MFICDKSIGQMSVKIANKTSSKIEVMEANSALILKIISMIQLYMIHYIRDVDFIFAGCTR